jgi:multicomponent Na+:H+ antiporter subunit E
MNLLLYICWLVKEIFLSSIMITKIIWNKNINAIISPSLEFAHTNLKNDTERVIYANSITLTPGTISVSLEKNKILVHSLTKEGLDLAPMEQEIKKIFKS